MALEGLPSASPAPATGVPVTGAAPGTVSATSVDDTLPLNFLGVLAGTLVSATSGSAAETLPATDSSTDTTSDDAEDEIGFEDLSEFLTQVIVPGPNPPPPPAPVESETTLEMDFSTDGGRASDLSDLVSALMAESRGKSSAPAGADANALASSDLLKDALTAEANATAASQPLDSMWFSDAEVSQPFSASPLHAASAHHVTQSAGTAPTAELRSTVGSPAWTNELGDHLTWMAQQGRESASLKISPEHLGPIEVRISVQDGQTSVWFGAANADTRAAIEQALPRLRDLFSAQGLSLADSGVFHEAPRQQQPQSGDFSGTARDGDTSEEISGVNSVSKRGNGILDLYA